MKSLLIGLLVLGTFSAFASDVRNGLYTKTSGSNNCPSQIAIEVIDSNSALVEAYYGEVAKQRTYIGGIVKAGRFTTKTEITESEIKEFVSQDRLIYGRKSISTEIYTYLGNEPLVDFDLRYTFNDLQTGKGFECRYNR